MTLCFLPRTILRFYYTNNGVPRAYPSATAQRHSRICLTAYEMTCNAPSLTIALILHFRVERMSQFPPVNAYRKTFRLARWNISLYLSLSLSRKHAGNKRALLQRDLMLFLSRRFVDTCP